MVFKSDRAATIQMEAVINPEKDLVPMSQILGKLPSTKHL